MLEKTSLRTKLQAVVRKKEFYACLALALYNIGFTKYLFENTDGGINTKWFPAIILFEIIAEFIILAILYKIRKSGAPFEKQFLFIAATLGCLFIIFIPPGQAPDEIAHFRRAYALSEGVIIPQENIYGNAIGSDIPVDAGYLGIGHARGTYRSILGRLIRKSDETSKQPYTSAALYNPICYLPQAIAILISKAFGLSVMGMSYVISCFDFLVWITLSYFAVKFTPRFKTIFAFILLFPMTLQEATSLSPDALTISLSFFFVAYILYLAYGNIKKLKKRDYIILSICSALIGLCKIVYLPLVLLILLIPNSRFKSKKKKIIVFGTIIFIAAILNVSWLLISAQYLVEFNPGVDSKAQLLGIISHPLQYLMVIFRTINAQGWNWLVGAMGLSIGGLGGLQPTVLIIESLAITVLLFIQKDESLNLKRFERLLIIFVFLSIIVLIFTSLYMQWTAVGSLDIKGIQGRYFIPILQLIPIVSHYKIPKSNNKYHQLISDKTILYYSVFTGMIVCVSVFVQNF